MANTQLLTELRAELAELKEAIKKAQRVQSYSTGGISVSAGNLKHLYDKERELQARIARLSGGCTVFRPPVFGDAK